MQNKINNKYMGLSFSYGMIFFNDYNNKKNNNEYKLMKNNDMKNNDMKNNDMKNNDMKNNEYKLIKNNE